MALDLQLLRGQGAATHNRLTPGLAIDGTPKAIQRFAQLFLRDYDPVRGRGTYFSQRCRNGAVNTTAAAVAQFTAGLAMVFAQLGDQTALPTNEQIQRVELLGVAITGDRIALSVRLYTPDGSTTFPVSVART